MSQALSKLEAAIEAKQKKLAQLKAQKQRIEARQRAKEQTLARKQDTRRKVLVGAMYLEKAQRNPAFEEAMLGELSAFLTRPDDRALFKLPIGTQAAEALDVSRL